MKGIAACPTCGTEPLQNARFCHGCGAQMGGADRRAEYKQVTVLFADVVHSMNIAAVVGAERLREIMTELVSRAMAVVQRYGATVDQFTGDGIMAVFGAPLTLEDHAFRACLAALDIQHEVEGLAAEVERRDGVGLQLRIGLNSGQVIAGDFGSAAIGYTAIGQQVGMAQRMESIAPPGGVMLSDSTAQLVDRIAVLGEPEMVSIKGADTPVLAHRLLGVASDRERMGIAQSTLVGRELELHTLTGLLDRLISGRGSVVGVVGPPGIGKSRLVREVVGIARSRGVYVNSHYCESHTAQIPFHAMAGLFRAAWIAGLDDATARALFRARIPDADPEDLLLLDDLMGIADPEVLAPRIDPDARRRRLTALINTANHARTEPVVYVIEDVHWIDEVSESMMADVLAVIGQTPTLALMTYRPEYEGALSRMHGAQTIALAPLTDSETTQLTRELLGADPSVDELAAKVVSGVRGNPFFAEEMVRELAQRGVLDGERGGYICQVDGGDVTVPGTVQATIGARIDRLDPAAKRTLAAAAVIGLRFGTDLLTELGIEPVVDELLHAELIDQVRFHPTAEYAFHHPLIRAVAYEAQLKYDRSEWHRRLASVIQSGGTDSVDENAALIAEHLDAAGDLRAAYDWHMRAAAWSALRDVAAAYVSWRRAREIADSLPSNDPDRTALSIATRTMMCLNSFRVGVTTADAGFEELRELCLAAGDKASLAIAMGGLAGEQTIHARVREASRTVSEAQAMAEEIGDPTLAVAVSAGSLTVKIVTGEMAQVHQVAQRVIDLAEGDPTKGNFIGLGSPLALALASKGLARLWLGQAGGREDLEKGGAMAEGTDPLSRSIIVYWTYGLTTAHGLRLADDGAVRQITDVLQTADRSADDVALGAARVTMAHVLLHRDSEADRERGLELLDQVGEMIRQGRYYLSELPVVLMYNAYERARRGDREEAIAVLRTAVDDSFSSGQLPHCLLTTRALVEILVDRRGDGDVAEAEAAIERLEAAPAEDGLAPRDVWLLRLRALLARVHGDEAAYRDLRDRYQAMSKSFGFEGHVAWAGAMP
ncbi:class 3 adenylate cyclase/energy-coupling factor transporter ATP-binding protein EcfA2 [Mycobacterium sp. OAS707]|uniref:ATP-binding protein n=1 Tax=Mycobacterium sp. OAS707 TaxID=2663822 RepID=UPI0017890FAA|nr:AAA family ATPase [Mycobacterium sp. OAS707]MBE1547559.1 class 3 adenylate cyclase/energy-coupling factor transporter ATP-binding protein EcfA2 [Mycobacterium sp. OAS707]